MIPVCKFCCLLYANTKTNFSSPIKSKKLKRWRQETSIPHSNSIKISSQVKEARHLYAKTKCMQVLFLQEHEGRQLNTPCDKLDLILSRFRVGSRPLLPQREAAVHIESVRGCQSCSPSRHQVLLPLSITALIELRRFTENNLFSPFFTECLFPTCSAHSHPTLGSRADLTCSLTNTLLGEILPCTRYQE